jgi:cell division transport system ATP-binding protein
MGNCSIPIIRMFHVHKAFGAQKSLVDISLDIYRNEFILVTGPSGAGKSTLLKLLYLAETVTQGQVIVDGLNLSRISRNRIPYLRRNFGIIFQDYKLIPTRTVFDNVALVLEAMGEKRRQIEKKVNSVLRTVEMEHKQGAFPLSLSGGEQQRVAVARAIAGTPRIILADEPTGNLDPDAAGIILSLLKDIHRKGSTVILATHDRMLIENAGGRNIHLVQGQMSPINQNNAAENGQIT